MHQLGHAPVHHQRLPERPEHDIARLQVAVNDSSAMCISNGIAYIHKSLQQPAELASLEIRGRSRVEPTGRRRQVFPFDEPHGIARTAISIESQTVDRHDSGVFQVSRDLGFGDEPLAAHGIAGVLRLDDLESHSSLQFTILGEENLSQTPRGMRPECPITRPLLWRSLPGRFPPAQLIASQVRFRRQSRARRRGQARHEMRVREVGQTPVPGRIASPRPIVDSCGVRCRSHPRLTVTPRGGAGTRHGWRPAGSQPRETAARYRRRSPRGALDQSIDQCDLGVVERVSSQQHLAQSPGIVPQPLTRRFQQRGMADQVHTQCSDAKQEISFARHTEHDIIQGRAARP